MEDLLFDVEAPQFGPPKMTASSIDRFRTVGEMQRAHGLHGHEGVLEVHACPTLSGTGQNGASCDAECVIFMWRSPRMAEMRCPCCVSGEMGCI